MKSAILIAAISALVSSASAANFFSVIAARSGSPIHLQELSANGESLWIGKKTGSFCPATVQKQGGCPKGTHTNFDGGNGGLGMGKHFHLLLFDLLTGLY